MQRIWIPMAALCAALALPLVAQEKRDDKPPVEAPKKPEPLKVGAVVDETLELIDFDGKVLSFKELRGKVVILHFWSDRCPAEKHADPVLKQLEGYYKGKDVVLVGVCSNQNELGAEPAKDADRSKAYANLRDKARANGFTHRIFVDHGNKLSALFGARSTPHCFVIDAKGVLAYTGALDDDMSGAKGAAAKVYVKDAADLLLAGKEVEVKQTRAYG